MNGLCGNKIREGKEIVEGTSFLFPAFSPPLLFFPGSFSDSFSLVLLF